MDNGLLKTSNLGYENKNVNTGNEGAKERLVADLKSVVADASDMLKGAANSSTEGLTSAREALQRKVDEARSQLSHVGTAFGGKAKYAAGATEEYVRANPWKSIGIAAAAALVVGAFLRRH
jgi:ElaB/YqjD/DUF883 family membrane-anchored ribosome-binding protein